jgi:hypothetical protein
MFKTSFHKNIVEALEAMDANLLLVNECFLGEGTAISLTNGEYRQSVDVDFVCSNKDGYRRLRTIATNKESLRCGSSPDSADDKTIEASGLNPWCLNEGTAQREGKLSTWWMGETLLFTFNRLQACNTR